MPGVSTGRVSGWGGGVNMVTRIFHRRCVHIYTLYSLERKKGHHFRKNYTGLICFPIDKTKKYT